MFQSTFENQSVIATGWGTEEFGGPLSPTLQKVTLNVIANRQCEDAFPGMVTAAQICTYRRNQDTCQVINAINIILHNLYIYSNLAISTIYSRIPVDRCSIRIHTTIYCIWSERSAMDWDAHRPGQVSTQGLRRTLPGFRRIRPARFIVIDK